MVFLCSHFKKLNAVILVHPSQACLTYSPWGFSWAGQLTSRPTELPWHRQHSGGYTTCPFTHHSISVFIIADQHFHRWWGANINLCMLAGLIQRLWNAQWWGLSNNGMNSLVSGTDAEVLAASSRGKKPCESDLEVGQLSGSQKKPLRPDPSHENPHGLDQALQLKWVWCARPISIIERVSNCHW